jgi:DNA-binding transcriptional regulator YhcF (GntR family)
MTAHADILDIEDYRMDSEKQETARYFEYRRLLRKALTPTEYLVFDILVDMANEELNQGWCWPSYTEISERAGELAPATISKAIERLESLDLVEVERPASKLTRNIANRYKPLKTPTAETNDVLGMAIIDRASAKLEAKEKKNHRFKKCIASKNEASSLQKMNTNVSNPTKPNLKTISKEIGPTAKEPISIKEKRQTKPKEPPNQNLQDPIILVWREIALENSYKYWPNKESQELLLRHIPHDQVPRFKNLIKQWLRKGHKIINIDGMVKVFWFGWDAFYSGQADSMLLPEVSREGIFTDATT